MCLNYHTKPIALSPLYCLPVIQYSIQKRLLQFASILQPAKFAYAYCEVLIIIHGVHCTGCPKPVIIYNE